MLILKRFGTDEAAVDGGNTVEYLLSHAEALDLAGEIDDWRAELIQCGLDHLTDTSSDPSN